MRLALIQPRFSYVMPYRLVPLSLSVLGELSKGWDVDIIDANFDRILRRKYDLVGITCSSFTAGSAYNLADFFRKRGMQVVIRGVHTTFEQEEAAMHADSIVTGEAEEIWLKVLDDFSNGQLKVIYHGGIIDMKKFPLVGPRYRQEKPAFYVSMPLLVQASRGCAHNCDFCTVSKFSGKNIRHREIKDIVKEIRINNAKSVLWMIIWWLIWDLQNHCLKHSSLWVLDGEHKYLSILQRMKDWYNWQEVRVAKGFLWGLKALIRNPWMRFPGKAK